MRFLAPLFAIAFCAAAEEPRKLAYERADAVWVANMDGSGSKKIADGISPDLSPDGKSLAFNTQQPDGKPAHRKIAVADLESGKVAVFEDVPSDNCLQPVWSPDGKQILFYYYEKNEMLIGVINGDGTGFRPLFGKVEKPHPYWSICWARDGQSIFGQDMEYLYQLGLDGSALKKWKIEKIVPRGGMSGNVRLDVSPDGGTLLMDVEMDEPTKRKEWDGPLPAIWTMNLATGKTVRLTPKSLFAWSGYWLGPDAIVFESQAAGEKDASIYRMSVNGKDLKRLVKNARGPSAGP